MPSCIVENCGNSSYKAAEKGVKLHPFPTQLHRIKQWLQAIPQKFGDLDSFAQQILDAKKTKPHRVCSHHFTPECYIYMSGKIYLSRDAVPSIFSSCDPPPAKKFCMDPSHIGWKEKPACVDVSTRTDIYNFGRDRGTQFDRYYGVKNKKISTEAKSFTRDVATLTDPRLQTSEPQMSTWGKKLKIITPRLNTADKYSQCPEYDFYRSQRLFNVSPSYKDLMAMSEELAHTGMKGNKDKNQRNEKILNLTLEIIYLLTGEDFMVMKRTSDGFPQNCTDCMLEGPCRRHTPTVAFSSDSVTNDKVVLELMSNIIQLLTGEEWDYIKGNKAFYSKRMEEDPQQLHPLDCPYEDMRDISGNLQATLCSKPATSKKGGKRASNTFAPLQPITTMVIKEEPTSWDEENENSITTKTFKEEPPSWEEENQSDCSINQFIGQRPGTDTPTTIMGCSTYATTSIKEELVSCEEGNQSDCSINPLTEPIQGTDTPTPIMGCSLNNSSAEDYISHKGEAALCEQENHYDRSINTHRQETQGTEEPHTSGVFLKNSST
ncbi:oocyte zinc finger protein XlCOF29-like isoform X2 [Xenopus laevis]|uniref:Oocyte zinc finger protein XlCOF29-like isoform X2 n=1 Tax=Xenopus laevis TaxID=8355 RepID=A0A8J0U4Y1_XENLA|nr:oocyte zinc finger protein XlCOF29-like isoform X2 [Xenopus laevis]